MFVLALRVGCLSFKDPITRNRFCKMMFLKFMLASFNKEYVNRLSAPSSFSAVKRRLSGGTGSVSPGLSTESKKLFENFSKILTDYVTIEQCFLESISVKFRLWVKEVKNDHSAFRINLLFWHHSFEHVQNDHVIKSQKSFYCFRRQHIQIEKPYEQVNSPLSAKRPGNFTHVQKHLVFAVIRHQVVRYNQQILHLLIHSQ